MPTQTILTSFLLLFCIGYSRGQWGLENLADRINAQVQQSLAPLHNLGQLINDDVKKKVSDSYKPLGDNWNPLGGDWSTNSESQLTPSNSYEPLGDNWNPLDSDWSTNSESQSAPLNSYNPLGDNWNPLGSDWSTDLESQLAPLNNLQSQINQQLEESLRPVRILKSTLKVKFGTDGTTVAIYSPGGKRLIIKESVLYVCNGRISDADGTCSVPLRKLKFDQKEDFCYSNTKTIVNGWHCLGSTGPLTTYFINGEFTCKSTDGSPTLLIRDGDYRKLCQNLATSVKYEYYTHLPLKDFGDGLQCSGHNPQVCTYSETFADLGRSGIVIVNK